MMGTSRAWTARNGLAITVATLAVAASACRQPEAPPAAQTTATAPAAEAASASRDGLAGKAARFAAADIGADVSGLAETERNALRHLIEAARVLDGLYLRQVWAGGRSGSATSNRTPPQWQPPARQVKGSAIPTRGARRTSPPV